MVAEEVQAEPRLYPDGEPERWPLVSVLVPAFNEERHIGKVIESLLAQDYPSGRFEVLILDGRSTDRTREVVTEWTKKDSRVLLLDNPRRIKPAALNLGVQAARGEVIVRIDAHSDYASDYLRLCVHNLLCTDADNVGGLRGTLPQEDTRLGWAIALSISSWFGSGGATYRSGAAERRWVDTVFCGTYRREIFDEIGLFDERLLRGQDREFNERLRRHGGRILFVPDIRVTYFARSRIGPFVRWIYDGGATPFFISRLAKYKIWSWRNLIPPAFVLALVILPVLSLVSPLFLIPWALAVTCYVLVAAAFSIRETFRISRIDLAFHLLLVFGITHLVYGVGALRGLLQPLASGDWVKS